MLTLTRRIGERIRIGPDIEVSVVSVVGNRVRLGIHAPRDVAVYRAEVIERVGAENRRAVAEVIDALTRAGLEITFPGGLLGLGGHASFLLCELGDQEPARALVSCTDPTVQLRVVDADEAWPGYPSDTARMLAGFDEETAVALVLRSPSGPGPTTVNLLAPLVIALGSRVARQVVLEGHALPTAAVLERAG